MSFATLAVTKSGHVAEIGLSRAGDGNPIDARFLDELEQAAASIHEYADIHVVLLTAAGDSFSRGASDGTVIPSPDHLPFRCLELMAQPVIACIQGDAVGAGLELALACDIRIAAEHASFGLAEVTRGIIPGAGGTQRLPRLMPFGAALELLMTGDRVGAAEAYRLGLVNRVVPLAELLPTALALAEKINGNGPLAVRAVKEAAYRGTSLPLGDGLRVETALWWATQQTEDAKEGPKAFAEKRKPEFKGR